MQNKAVATKHLRETPPILVPTLATLTHFQSYLQVPRRSAEAARRYSTAKWQKQTKTSAVKHKTAGSYRSGRPNNVTQWIVAMRTKVKILQHDRLDANCFCFSKNESKQKPAPTFLKGQLKFWRPRIFFRDGRQPKAHDFLRLNEQLQC